MAGGGSPLADRLRQRLALLGRHQSADFRCPFAHQVGGLVEDRGALADRCIAPQGKGAVRSIKRAVEVSLGGHGQIGNRLTGGRIDDLVDITVRAVDPLAIDMELQFLGICTGI